MPNIVSSSCSSTGIDVTASNGARVILPTSWIYGKINDLAGADADLTRQTVERAVAEQIASTLGYANVLPDQIAVTVNMETGAPEDLSFYG